MSASLSSTIEAERELQLLARGVTEPYLRPKVESAALCRVAATPTLICAWCDKENGVVRSLASGASHGICDRHTRMMRDELAGRMPTLPMEGPL